MKILLLVLVLSLVNKAEELSPLRATYKLEILAIRTSENNLVTMDYINLSDFSLTKDGATSKGFNNSIKFKHYVSGRTHIKIFSIDSFLKRMKKIGNKYEMAGSIILESAKNNNSIKIKINNEWITMHPSDQEMKRTINFIEYFMEDKFNKNLGNLHNFQISK